jgi:hypothetical protein
VTGAVTRRRGRRPSSAGAARAASFLVPDFCSYVGREGAVLFTQYGTIVRKKVVPFVAAGDLKLTITRILLAGRHVGAVHHFRFISTGGGTLLSLKAPTAGASAATGAHIHFARALQRAWEAHRAGRAA